MYMCVYMHMYICIYVHMYIYVYMYISMFNFDVAELQCVAVCCSVLQYVAKCKYCRVASRRHAKSRAARIPHVLQCVAVCRSVLQYVAVCWRVSTLQRVLSTAGESKGPCSRTFAVLQCLKQATQSGAVCFSVLQCVSVCCSVLQCVAVCCSVLQ